MTTSKNLSVSIIGTKGYPYVYGGYETLIKELSERLIKLNCEVTVYCHRGLFSERPKSVNGINLVYIPGPESKALSQLVHSFLSMVHACFSKTDVILVVNPANGPMGLISKLFRKPTAINMDGLEWLRPKWKGFPALYYRFAVRSALVFYDALINDAEAMRQIYLKKFKKDSTVIAYGGNLQFSSNPELIKTWDLLEREYYLIVGRLIPDNNADILIKGFLASKSKRKLVVVGDVFYKDTYADSLKSLKDDRLIFTGYVYDSQTLAELYHNCYAYLHGHEFGGTNPTMIKAMAYGTAIIALNTVFNKEMLSEDLHGLYFEKNKDSACQLIEYAENNENKIIALRKTSQQGITRRYNWDYITQQYLNLFYKLKAMKS